MNDDHRLPGMKYDSNLILILPTNFCLSWRLVPIFFFSSVHVLTVLVGQLVAPSTITLISRSNEERESGFKEYTNYLLVSESFGGKNFHLFIYYDGI